MRRDHDKISIAIFQAGLTMIEGKRSTDVFIYALKFLQKAEHRTKDLSELSLIFQIEELIWGTDWNDDQAIIKLEKEFAEIFRKFKTLKGSKDTIKILHSSTNIKSTKS